MRSLRRHISMLLTALIAFMSVGAQAATSSACPHKRGEGVTSERSCCAKRAKKAEASTAGRDCTHNPGKDCCGRCDECCGGYPVPTMHFVDDFPTVVPTAAVTLFDGPVVSIPTGSVDPPFHPPRC